MVKRRVIGKGEVWKGCEYMSVNERALRAASLHGSVAATFALFATKIRTWHSYARAARFIASRLREIRPSRSEAGRPARIRFPYNIPVFSLSLSDWAGAPRFSHVYWERIRVLRGERANCQVMCPRTANALKSGGRCAAPCRCRANVLAVRHDALCFYNTCLISCDFLPILGSYRIYLI